MPYERVHVERDSGESFDCPMAFIFEERRWEVAEIVDRWYEGGLEPRRPGVDYFKVRAVEGDVFFLRYVSLFDAWSIWVEETEEFFWFI